MGPSWSPSASQCVWSPGPGWHPSACTPVRSRASAEPGSRQGPTQMVHRTCLCQRTRGSRIVAPPAPASRSVTSTGAVARGMCQVRGPEMSDELRVSGWGPATSWRFLQKEAGSPGQGQRVLLEGGRRGGKGQARDARMLGKAGNGARSPTLPRPHRDSGPGGLTWDSAHSE